MPARRSPALTALVFWLLLAIFPWSAQAFTHVVQPGDTLASIAERYYGKVQHENLLVVANALEAQGGTRIVPGMLLEVPALTHVRIGRGQTWKKLALKLLGHEQRATVLAGANGTKPWLPPDNDAEIIVPYNLRFIATGNETVVGLAYRFMGDRKMGWMLDNYNQRKGRRLQRGEVLLIPITDIELTAAGKEAAGVSLLRTQTQGGGVNRKAQLQVIAQIGDLKANIRKGQYVEAVRQAIQFLSQGRLRQGQRATIYRQLLEAYAALGAIGRAAEACALWMKDDPHAKLDPIRMSPKLIEACKLNQQPQAAPAGKPSEPGKPQQGETQEKRPAPSKNRQQREQGATNRSPGAQGG
jgi:hypothetical protein